MTRLHINSTDLPSLLAQMSRASVGFDQMFNRLHQYSAQAANSINYPPHNIVKVSDTCYYIEIAVAGFTEQELNVEVENNVLTVTGEHLGDAPEYLYQGISNKSFTKTISLAEHVVVTGATCKNGLLQVNLEIVVPEEFKPRRIAINGSE